MKWSEWFAAMEGTRLGVGSLGVVWNGVSQSVSVVWNDHLVSLSDKGAMLWIRVEGGNEPSEECATPDELRAALNRLKPFTCALCKGHDFTAHMIVRDTQGTIPVGMKRQAEYDVCSHECADEWQRRTRLWHEMRGPIGGGE